MKRKQPIKLKLDPRNARRHGDRNDQLVEQSLREIGAFRSIAADADGIIRAGNKTFEKAQQLGYKIRIVKGKPDELVVVQRDDLRGKKAVRAALLDNRASDLSEWDSDALASMAKNEGKLLDGLFDERELVKLGASIDGVEFNEYDETVEKEVKTVPCPNCGFAVPV